MEQQGFDEHHDAKASASKAIASKASANKSHNGKEKQVVQLGTSAELQEVKKSPLLETV